MTRPQVPGEPDPPPLSEAQLEIMNVVWEQRRSDGVRGLEGPCGRARVARNTIQTMMVRLEEKGWLRCSTKDMRFAIGRRNRARRFWAGSCSG